MAEKETKKKIDPLQMIMEGKILSVKKKTRRGEFEIKFPLPSDFRKINLLMVDRMDGHPAEFFTKQAIENIQLYALLDVLVINAPDWWKKLNSSEECPDNDLVRTLFQGYLRFNQKIQHLLADGTTKEFNSGNVTNDDGETLVNGALSGITNGCSV